MKCVNHPSKEASYLCRKCTQPVCEDCTLNINGEHICKVCVETGYPQKFKEGKMVRLFHFLCSLIPGAGQMQQGAMKRGVQIMLSFFALAVIAVMIRAEELLFFGVVIWFYSFFDSYHVKKAKKTNVAGWDREFIKAEYLQRLFENKESKWAGWILICVGILVLFNLVMGQILYLVRNSYFSALIRLIQDSFLPLVAVILGWSILKNAKDVQEEQPALEEKIVIEDYDDIKENQVTSEEPLPDQRLDV